jgi:hypothetical protein
MDFDGDRVTVDSEEGGGRDAGEHGSSSRQNTAVGAAVAPASERCLDSMQRV